MRLILEVWRYVRARQWTICPRTATGPRDMYICMYVCMYIYIHWLLLRKEAATRKKTSGRQKVTGNCDRVELTHSWWRHQMETFSALLALCAGNSPVTGEFPSQRPVTRSIDVFFDLRPNKQLSKQWFETLWDAIVIWDDLRRHRAHYDVTVMDTYIQYVINRKWAFG